MIDPHAPPATSIEQDTWLEIAEAVRNAAFKLAMKKHDTVSDLHATIEALTEALCFNKLAMTFDAHVKAIIHQNQNCHE